MEVPLPTVSFSLAAIVRRCTQQSQGQQRPQEYAIVHEKPPRGWWLPGGGIEHVDATPVDAAIRESVEEAGSPSILPLLALSQSKFREDMPELRSLPVMTHLISLEQTRGRIRFIFRGEWVDDSDTSNEQTGTSIAKSILPPIIKNKRIKSKEPASILKLPPGDGESIEAKWITWDEVLHFEERKRSGMNKPSPMLQSISDPWLRGHEPITFFGMLEFAHRKDGSVPGLPVHMMDLPVESDTDQKGVVTGAFFGRMQKIKSDNSSADADLISHGGRAALHTHLRCRLVVYDKIEQTFAIDASTRTFPSSCIKRTNEMSLRKLVDGMIASFDSGDNIKNREVGLLRVEYIKHDNEREATLTVFPFLSLHSTIKSGNDAVRWVSAENLSDDLERKLAKVIVGNQNGKEYFNLDVLRDHEGPIEVAEVGGTDNDRDINVHVGVKNLDTEGSAFLDMIKASQESDQA